VNSILHLDNPLPSRWITGRGAILPLQGQNRDHVITCGSQLCVGERQFRLRGARPRLDVDLKAGQNPLSGWEALATMTPEMEASQVGVSINKRTNGIDKYYRIGIVDIVKRPGLEQVQLPGSCQIAICMATYNPQIRAFERQIASIQAQTCLHWHCIVQDDGSEPETLTAMRAICAKDTRFSIFAGADNCGFYHNFERCLYRVPDHIPYVALSDQDDEWLPEKLQILLDGLGAKDLIYSDMKIVDEQGQLTSDTYWTHRRNNYRDMETVFLANTITGAAALFRRQLLELALPFPVRIGDAFHDHWLGLCAFAGNGVAYVDLPLYSYYQHVGNVIGHCEDINPVRLSKSSEESGSPSPIGLMARILRRLQGLEYGYQQEFRRLQLMARTLLLRQPQLSGQCRSVVRPLADDGWRCALFLLRSHLRIRRRGDTTGDAELRLFAWLVGHWVLVMFTWIILLPYSQVCKFIRRNRT